MMFNRLGAFTLGVIITAVSVGAVSFVNASGDANIRACANKKTGAMRYIAKGKCKKTEKALSWNQLGPQGLNGAQGVPGASGTDGANGKSLFVVDAMGNTIGQVLGDGTGGNTLSPTFLTLSENRIWFLASNDYRVDGTGAFEGDYSDQTCTLPLGRTSYLAQIPNQMTFGYKTLNGGETYVVGSKYADMSDLSKPVYTGEPQNCRLRTSAERGQTNFSLWNMDNTIAPTYKAPLTIVAK